MKTTYLIDGYNLIHALGMIRKKADAGGLEASRAQLLGYLAAAFAEEAAHVTIVFDAKQGPRRLSRTQHHQQLAIQFAPKEQSADDLIETLIEQEPRPKSLVVVSNDARLQTAAKRRGAQAWSDQALLDHFEKKKSPPTGKVDEKKASVTPEESQRWLDEFRNLQFDPELKEFFDQDRFEDQ